MCSVLADKRHIFTDEKMPAVFYKYERAPRAFNKTDGEFLETSNYTLRNVTPVQIGGVFNLREDLSKIHIYQMKWHVILLKKSTKP